MVATDAHFGGPPRIPVRTSDRLLGQGPLKAPAPGGKEGPPHHVVGGEFSKRAAAARTETIIGLASPPHVREKTPPSYSQVRSIDSAMKHFGATRPSAVAKVSRPGTESPKSGAPQPAPKPQPQTEQPLPSDTLSGAVTAPAVVSTLGDVRRELACWASALPSESEHDHLPPDVARRKRKADIADAIRASKKWLRQGRGAVELLEDVGPTAPSDLSEAVQELSAEVGAAVVQKLIHTGRVELASQWSAAVSGWLGAVAALVPPLAAVCVDGANTLACVCLSRSNLPDDADNSMIRPLATAAAQAVRHSLKALKALRAQDKVALSVAPGVHPTAALAARCHLNGCAADGRIGRHRPALEHAVRARKAALSALADASSKKVPAATQAEAGETSESAKHSADAAELLVLAWHAAGAQHESLDEPAFCLAAYEKAYAVCKKHSVAKDSALLASVRRDLESAQRRFAKNRALTTLEIQRGIEAELGGGGPPPKRKQARSQGPIVVASTDGDIATGAARAEMQSSMFTGLHKSKKKQNKQQDERPAWDARPAALSSKGNGRDTTNDLSAKLHLPTVGPASGQRGAKQKGRRGRQDNVLIPGERKLKAEGRAAVRQMSGEHGEKTVVIRAAEGSLSLPPIRVC